MPAVVPPVALGLGLLPLFHRIGLWGTTAGVTLTHIPYKGTPPALVDIIAGRIDAMFAAVAPALPHIRAERLRAIAVTTGKRSSILPDLPTAAETVPGFEAETWYGLLAPAGTPGPVIGKLNREVVAFLSQPATAPFLHQQGFEAVGGTPKEFAGFLLIEHAEDLCVRQALRRAFNGAVRRLGFNLAHRAYGFQFLYW